MLREDERESRMEQVALGLNRHREERSDAAIQGRRFGSSSLDRFAVARDDGSGSTKPHDALDEAATRPVLLFDESEASEAAG